MSSPNMPKFWKYLPEGVYNTWQANDWKQKQLARLQDGSMLEKLNGPPEPDYAVLPPSAVDTPHELPEGAIPGYRPGISTMGMSGPPDAGMAVEGAAGGGEIMDRVRGKLQALRELTDPFKDAAGSALGASAEGLNTARRAAVGGVKTGFNAYQKYVDDPIGAIGSIPLRAKSGPMSAESGGLIGLLGGPNLSGGTKKANSSFGVGDTPESLTLKGLQDYREKRRKEMNPLENIGTDILADPLTYTPFVATKLTKLGPAGRAAASVLEGPGRGIDAALSGTSKLSSRTPGLSKLLQPSGRALASAEGERLGNIAARLVDEIGGTGYGLAENDPVTLQRVAEFLASDPSALSANPRLRARVFGELENTSHDPEEGFNLLKQAAGRGSKKGVATPDTFVQNARDLGRESLTRAQRELNPRGPVGSALEAIGRPVGKVSQALSSAVLGTAMFPVGNVAEDIYRAGGAGRMTAREAAGKLRGFEGDVPTWLRTEGENATSLGRSVGASTSAVGPGFKLPGTEAQVHPLDIISGQKFLRAGAKPSTEIRRNWMVNKLMDEFASRADAVASGRMTVAEAQKAAAAAAGEALRKTFPSYHMESVLDQAMKTVMPFWGYESSRWPYLARQVGERPGVMAGVGHFLNDTEGGKINVPSGVPIIGDTEIQPFKGTVFGGLGSVARQDYPTFSNGLSGQIEQATQAAGKLGFWPSAPVSAGFSLIRAMEGQDPEVGSMLPSTFTAPINALQATRIPGIADAAVKLQDALGGNRFRDYAIRKELAAMGINPEEADDKQKRAAAMTAGFRQLLATESNVAQFRPAEEQAYKAAVKQAARDAGIPDDVISKQLGDPLGATNPETGQRYLDKATKRGIYEANPGWEAWRQVSEPLKQPADQERVRQQREYFQDIERVNKETEAALKTLYQNQSTYTGSDFRARRSDIMDTARIKKEDALSRRPLVQETLDPAKREEFYQRTGRTAPEDTAQDQKAQQYYAVKPRFDETTGQTDWNGWRQEREAILNSADPQTRDYILNQYRRKSFSDPTVLAGEQRFEQFNQKAQQYYNLPQYLGLNEDQSAKASLALKQISTIKQMRPNISDDQAREAVRKVNPQGVLYVRGLSNRRNPARKKFLQQNPDLIWFFGDLSETEMSRA